MRYINQNIKELVRIYPNQERGGYLRLDMNENPGGLSSEIVDEVLKKITPQFLATYPEPNKVAMLVAGWLDVNVGNIFLANGSDACIRYVYEVFGNPAGNVVTVNPTFEMYKVYGKMFGLEHKAVEYDAELKIDYLKIIAAIDECTSIVALLNPNNPIGNVYGECEARAIIEKAQSVNAVVVIDEAYHYFYSETLLGLTKEYDNLVVLRTFSKLMSLAACRLGIAVADARIIKYMKNAQPTFEVNAIALLFAEHILQNKDIVKQLVAIERAGHSYLVASTKQAGYELIDGRGNYVFIKPRKSTCEIAQLLEQEKILVKTYNHEFLKKYIRISTGDVKYMQIFLEAFLRLDNN